MHKLRIQGNSVMSHFLKHSTEIPSKPSAAATRSLHISRTRSTVKTNSNLGSLGGLWVFQEKFVTYHDAMGLLVEEGEKRLVIAWWPSPSLWSLFVAENGAPPHFGCPVPELPSCRVSKNLLMMLRSKALSMRHVFLLLNNGGSGS